MAVPGCLGRILTGPDGSPAGTCVQLDAGVLVTAAHVLALVGADSVGAVVAFDPLGEPDRQSRATATVARLDLVHDLAVLTTTQPLPTVAASVARSDEQAAAEPVRGVGVAEDAHRPDRTIDVTGTWRGGVLPDDGTAWATVGTTDTAPGMAGAPVLRASDDAVLGIVCLRYNNRDGWRPDAVWVSRTEDLLPLLAGVADLAAPPADVTDDLLDAVYRHVEAPDARVTPGPLRIVVAIAGDDHDAGLRSVHAAARDARLARAQVKVVPFADTAALRAELAATDPHVLHVVAPSDGAALLLETETGQARPVDAATLLAEAVPDGRTPAVIALHGDVAPFAERLAEQGASVVIVAGPGAAYATRVFARTYAELAHEDAPDVIAAVARARHVVTRDTDLDGTVTVHANARHVPIVDAQGVDERVTAPRGRRSDLLRREYGEFVGRRRELRTLPDTLLAADGVGIVLHGVGGIGKTTLAAELVDIVHGREPGRLIAVASGELTVDRLLATVGAVLRSAASGTEQPAEVERALEYFGRTAEPWPRRWQVLREVLLPRFPLLLVLDDFEANLTGKHRVRDEYLAGVLALWAKDPGPSRLIVVSHRAFELPEQAQARLVAHHLGPMSRAELLTFAWSLPAVDRLPDLELARLWQLVGGHPRALEYVDALLATGKTHFVDVNDRIESAVRDRFGEDAAEVLRLSTIDIETGEKLALAASEVVLPALMMSIARRGDARRLLFGLAVYREPVDVNAALFHIGQSDESAAWTPDRAGLTERINEIVVEAGLEPKAPMELKDVPEDLRETLAPLVTELYSPPKPPIQPRDDLGRLLGVLRGTGLLTVGLDGNSLFVNRFTAAELERTTDADESSAVRHRNAAGYWRWRALDWPQDESAHVHDLLEARYHFLAAGEVEAATNVAEHVGALLQRWGAWDRATELAQDTLRVLPADSPQRPRWLLQLGLFAHVRGDHDVADSRYQTALDTSQSLGDDATAAAALHRLGALEQDRGDDAAAELRFVKALEITERVGDDTGTAAIQYQRGTLAERRDDFAEARRLHLLALEINERLTDDAATAASHAALGTVARRHGDLDEAVSRCRSALEVFERADNHVGVAAMHHELGALAQLRDDVPEAERAHLAAMAIEERLGNALALASSHGVLGMLAEQRGDLDEAERRYQQAMELHERIGNAGELATTYGLFGRLRAAQGRHHEAIDLQLRSLSIRSRMQSPEAARNVSVLSELRQELGADAFEQEVRSILDEENARALTQLLDRAA